MAGVAWYCVAEPGALGIGECRTVSAGSRLLALARSAEGYHALDNQCPHRGGPLGQGTIEGDYLVCPWHGRSYRLGTGECLDADERISAYSVEERSDGIYVAVEA